MSRLLSVLVVALLLCARPSAAEFSSYAVIKDDASLVIQNKVVRLFGVYIPDPRRFCDTQLRPAFCGDRAATALNFKIQGFVTCQEMSAYDDGSISAICWTKRSNFSEGTDLGAYLIREGLALAGPDAPFEYQALERIAQTNGLGVWGFQAPVPASLHRSATQRDTLPLRKCRLMGGQNDTVWTASRVFSLCSRGRQRRRGNARRGR